MIDSDQFQPKYLHLERIDDILVATIKVHKWVTEEKVQEIGDEIYAAIEHATEKSLLLDFINIQYMGIAVIGKLINSKKKCGVKNIKLMLCSINSALLEVFRVTRLDQVFYIYKNREIIVDGPPTQAGRVRCPLHECGGWVRFEATYSAQLYRREFECAFCRCSFQTEYPRDGIVPHITQVAFLPVKTIIHPTYDSESVCVLFGADRPVTIRVNGRIDLFTVEALEQLWNTVPAPRQILFDLSSVTELTPQGSNSLHALQAGDAPDEGVAAIIHINFRRSRELFPANWSLHLKDLKAQRKLRRRFGERNPALEVPVQWE